MDAAIAALARDFCYMWLKLLMLLLYSIALIYYELCFATMAAAAAADT